MSGDANGLASLEFAAKNSTNFFSPTTTLFKEYPSERKQIINNYDVAGVADGIETFFERDFDEGIHLAGQYHNSNYSDPDDNLEESLDFLIGTKQSDKAKQVVERIEESGIISGKTSETLSMLNLSAGNIEQAVTGLEKSNNSQLNFYLALSHLKQGQKRNVIPDLIKTVDGCT